MVGDGGAVGALRLAVTAFSGGGVTGGGGADGAELRGGLGESDKP